MQTKSPPKRLCRLYPKWLVLLGVTGPILAVALAAECQGTVTFNAHPYFSGTNYVEQGMRFGLVVPTAGNHDGMAISPAITSPWNTPYNVTPYMVFFQQFSQDDYITLRLTNGLAFGLTSVQLADPTSPSPSPVPISFVGHLAGGSTVTNTFTTPGNGATTFLSYSFTSAFAPRLLRVDILAPRWAMDNLVFTIPEPSGMALVGLGLLALLLRRRGGRT